MIFVILYHLIKFTAVGEMYTRWFKSAIQWWKIITITDIINVSGWSSLI